MTFTDKLQKRPIAVAMFTIAVISIGLIAVLQLPIELLPALEYPRMSLSASWTGASPESIESQLTTPLEAIAVSIPGVKSVSSSSGFGYAQLTIELLRTANPTFVRLELKDKLARFYEQLPEEIKPPKIRPYIPREFRDKIGFMRLRITGSKSLDQLRKISEEVLRPGLIGMDGVGEISITGGAQKVLRIQVSRALMHSLGLDIQDIYRQISAFNKEIYLGKISNNDQIFWVKLESLDTHPVSALSKLPISAGDLTVLLGDLATIKYDYDDPETFFRINGRDFVVMEITREPGSNILALADDIHKKLENFKKESALPPDVKIDVIQDRSQDLKEDISVLLKSVIFSAGCLFLILLMAFRSMAAVIIVFVSLIFSLCLTFIVMFFCKISVNSVTLIGLGIALGIMADNAIVVIDRLQKDHATRKTGELEESGIRSVRVPIFASTLTTLGAFLPLVILSAQTKLYLIPFAIVVSSALVASTLSAFTLVYVATHHFILRFQKNYPQEVISDETESEKRGGWQATYWWLLNKTIRHRRFAIIAMVWLFGIPLWLLPDNMTFNIQSKERGEELSTTQMIKSRFAELYDAIFANEAYLNVRPYIDKVLGGSHYLFYRHVPIVGSVGGRVRLEDSYVTVDIKMPRYTEVKYLLQVVSAFETHLDKFSSDIYYETRVANNYEALLKVKMARRQDPDDLLIELQQVFEQVAVSLGGIECSVQGYGPGFRNLRGADISNLVTSVSGYNYLKVKEIAQNLAVEISKHRRFSNISIDQASFGRKPAWNVVAMPDREQLWKAREDVGTMFSRISSLTLSDGMYRSAIEGEKKDIPVYIDYLSEDRVHTISDLNKQTQATERVLKVEDIAQIEKSPTLPVIHRRNQAYSRLVTCDYAGLRRYGGRIIWEIQDAMILPLGYGFNRGGFGFFDDEGTLWGAVLLSAVLIYMILSALYESFRQPFIILWTVPMAFIGLFLVFFISDGVFTQGGYFAMVFLIGISVNNAIILLYQLQKRAAKNQAPLPQSAIFEVCLSRLRPILVTGATSIGGLLPFLIWFPNGTLWHAFALGTVGGLCFSSIGVLLILPALFVKSQK